MFEDWFRNMPDDFEELGELLTGSGAAIIGFVGFLYFALFLWIILHLVAWCKLFTKAGLPWERMFVPIYGTYWQFKVAESPGIFWINFFSPMLISGITLFSGVGIFAATTKAVNNYSRTSYSGSRRVSSSAASSSALENQVIGSLSIVGIIVIILAVALFVLNCIWLVRLAKCYGRSGGFAVGLILLYPIFILILGFGSSEYVGSQGDFSKIRETTVKKSWTCEVCHTVNPASRATCETCGASKT